jgi:hypothetical protein
MNDKDEDQNYEISLRVLGNEVFGVRLASSSTSNKWVFLSIITIFCLLVLIGAYGDSFVTLYKWLVS